MQTTRLPWLQWQVWDKAMAARVTARRRNPTVMGSIDGLICSARMIVQKQCGWCPLRPARPFPEALVFCKYSKCLQVQAVLPRLT